MGIEMKTKNASMDSTSKSSTGDRVVPLRHPIRAVSSVVVVTFVILSLIAVAFNPRFEWAVVGQYLFSEQILLGLRRTLELTAVAAALAAVLGCILALMRLSQNRLFNVISSGYIWAFRATPLLVQILFWYNLGALYPQISVGIPGGPGIVLGDSNDLITPLTAAILALALHEAAYTAEVCRAGILSVNKGQGEAAKALGLSPAKSMRWVVLPQALRIIIPPLGNNTIHLLKSTSLVSVISMTELLYSAQIVYARTFETIPLLVVASIWYLVIVSIMTLLQSMIEQRLTGTRQQGSSFWRGVGQRIVAIRRAPQSAKGSEE